MKIFFQALLAITTLVLVGCGGPERTVEQLQSEISAYQEAPGDVKEQQIEKLFAQLDQEIANLKAHGKTQRAAELASQRDQMRGEFAAARLGRVMHEAKAAVNSIADTIKGGTEALRKTFDPNAATPKPSPAE